MASASAVTATLPVTIPKSASTPSGTPSSSASMGILFDDGTPLGAPLLADYKPGEDPLKEPLTKIVAFLSSSDILVKGDDLLLQSCEHLGDGLKKWTSLNQDNADRVEKIVGLLVTKSKEVLCPEAKAKKDPGVEKGRQVYDKIVSKFIQLDLIREVVGGINTFVTQSKYYPGIKPETLKTASTLIKVAIHFFNNLDTAGKEELLKLQSLVLKPTVIHSKEEMPFYTPLKESFTKLTPPTPTPARKASQPSEGVFSSLKSVLSSKDDPKQPASEPDDFVFLMKGHETVLSQIKESQLGRMCDIFRKFALSYGQELMSILWSTNSKELLELESIFKRFAEKYCFHEPQRVENFEVILIKEMLSSVRFFFTWLEKRKNLYSPESKSTLDEQTKLFVSELKNPTEMEQLQLQLNSVVKSLLISRCKEKELDVATELEITAKTHSIVGKLIQYVNPSLVGYLCMRFLEEQPEKGKKMFDTLDDNPSLPKIGPLPADPHYKKLVGESLFEVVKAAIKLGNANFVTAKGVDTQEESIKNEKSELILTAISKIKASRAMMMPFLIVEHLLLKTPAEGNQMPIKEYLSMTDIQKRALNTRHKEFMTTTMIDIVKEQIGALGSFFSGDMTRILCYRFYQVTQSQEAMLTLVLHLLNGFARTLEQVKDGRGVIRY